MATNINTIITKFDRLYPANFEQIWTILKRDNPSLTDEIIEQLRIGVDESEITIDVKESSTEYEGSIVINSYQYNLFVQIDEDACLVYNFNNFCSDTGTFTVRTNEGYKTFTTDSIFTTVDFIENPNITHIDDNFLRSCKKINTSIRIPEGITSIGHYFLYNCENFNQKLTLPNSLTSIGNSFLYNCSSFNQPLTLPNLLESIGIYFMYGCDNFNQKLTISDDIPPSAFSFSDRSFATINSGALIYTNGFKIKYDKFDMLLERFPNSTIYPYRNLIQGLTTFIAKETSLSYKYHLNIVLGEHDIKVYLVKENEVTMKFDKPITTILPDTSTGKLLIGNALKNLPKEQLTETAIETKITAINFYNK